MQVAFLFDNDGVLMDSSALHWEAWQKLQLEVPELRTMEFSSFKRNFGKRNDLILEDIIPHIAPDVRRQWADRKEELFRQVARGRITLLPGMESFLKKTVKAKIPHIIASSTPTANLEMFLTTTVLGSYFDHYLSAETLAHGKPFPDIFLAAAEKIGYPPQQCIVFEDAPSGLQAGRAAGCFLVAIESTHTKEELYPYDLCYPSASALNLEEILSSFAAWTRNQK